ncbi:membrane protein insertase YidC [Lysobacteraceae bacterium NML95-0200]|nr:membrane protein insertase YidC [Xanthomonadaceae bacterium NML95-0200]
MNQSRVFLLIAWLMVATLLWMEWGKEQQAARMPAAPVASAQPVPQMVPGQVPQAGNVPAAPGTQNAAMPATAAAGNRVEVRTDVLHLTLGGGSVVEAELLKYPQTRDAGSAPVRLFNADNNKLYSAQSGWVGQNGSKAPNHLQFQPVEPGKQYVLGEGQSSISIPFVWEDDAGLKITRTYTLKRDSYVVEVKDEAHNGGEAPWSGYIYRQLVRVPPQIEASMFHPESYSFNGATWWDGGYERRPFKDFLDDGKINQTVEGGWLAMLQHHFFTAWIPQKDQSALYTLEQQGVLSAIAATGPQFTLAPGQKAQTRARLWVGPKLVDKIAAENVKGLDRAVDYSRFSVFAVLGQGLFWVLSTLHGWIGNWGWAIIGLVCLLRILMFPLSSAQFKSAAKMRKFQPRLQQLKERYGDDRQKFQQAMMELYRTEKINPMAGCLPIIPQMLIFMTLYWVLSEAVELRHAPWIGWIHDLTARDPYFILPALNAAIMMATQHLTPMAPGMDPMQQRMFKLMPLIFGVILAFLPSGLVLYQVANGGLSLLQQWYMLKKHGEAPGKATFIPKDKK